MNGPRSGGPGSSGLGARADALDRLGSKTFDLLVVGGGITGAGVALDAATRGLTVALVEARDFASGTSSRSSKLVHGGLRYLEQGEIGLVRQSARERELLRRLAPHLVRPLQFVLPKGSGAESLLMRAGLVAYDLLAGVDGRWRHRSVSRREAAELAAGIEARAGAFVYHDCETDDSRLTIEVLRAACRAGAVVCNHAETVGMLVAGGRAAGCEVRDAIGGAAIEVRAADVVNASGVWADEVRRLEDAGALAALRPSKGIHLVLPRAVLPLDAACLVPNLEEPGRRIFAVPWRSSVVVGPTDTDYAGPLA
ncbi:MAG TPA: glycerol-3-phosphate dehydrogenase/oxidase, partial [Actinomycetota bacterium]